MDKTFLAEYKVKTGLPLSLTALLSSHALPVGSVVAVGNARFEVKAVQPVVFRWFADSKKLHIYYDAFRIFDGHKTCLDRIHLSAKVRTVLYKVGINGIVDFVQQFKPFSIQDYLSYSGSSFIKRNGFVYSLYINHFDEEIELSAYK